jgi:exonuclease SbcD
MRILHTSDWHVGRTFHQNSTLDALEQVFGSVYKIVSDERIDVVVVAGDIYDSSTPSADAVNVLNRILAGIRAAGAAVVLTSGNHDSPARLGTMKAFASEAGVHIITSHEQITDPVTLTDTHGPIHFYGIPFLEPARVRHLWQDTDMRTQKDAVGYAMNTIRADVATRGGRTIVLAHTFVQGAEGESCDSERDIVTATVGGVDKVPVSTFDGVTYAALGHIHGRSTLADNVRYSGAPLHYSFSEAGKGRGGWIIDLDASEIASTTWVDFPVPRELSVITGTLESLLSDQVHAAVENHWISAVITDNTRPLDAMRKLQARFPYCAHLDFRPTDIHDVGATSYGELVHGKTDEQIIDGFLQRVRNGDGPSEEESALIRDVIALHGAEATA